MQHPKHSILCATTDATFSRDTRMHLNAQPWSRECHPSAITTPDDLGPDDLGHKAMLGARSECAPPPSEWGTIRDTHS